MPRRRLIGQLLVAAATLVSTAILVPGGSALAWTTGSPSPVDPYFFGSNAIAGSDGTWVPHEAQSVRLWDSGTRWSNIETGRGTYNWSWPDYLVSKNDAAGKSVLFTFGGTPKWTSINPRDTSCLFYDKSRPTTPGYEPGQCLPPSNYTDWDNYVRAVATRYKGKIDAYELWNEVNIPSFWKGSPVTMAHMARDATSIIHSVDPKAIVVAPSIVYVQNPANVDYLSQLISNGGLVGVNAAAVHLYYYRGPNTPELNVAGVHDVQSRLAAAGLHIPVWNTENAWGVAGQPAAAPQVEQDIMARNWLVQTYLGIPRGYYYTPNQYMSYERAGTPSYAAVQQLKTWYRGASVQGCAHGSEGGLPFDIWQCTFSYGETSAGYSYAQVRWSTGAPYTEAAPAGTSSVSYVGAAQVSAKAGSAVMVSQRPVLVRFTSSVAPGGAIATPVPTYVGPATDSLVPAPVTATLSEPAIVTASSWVTSTVTLTRSDLRTPVPAAHLQVCIYTTYSSCSPLVTNSAGQAQYGFRANYGTTVQVFPGDVGVSATGPKQRVNVYSLLHVTGGYHKVTYSTFPATGQTYWVQRWTGSAWSTVRTGAVTTSATQTLTAGAGTYRLVTGGSSWVTYTTGPSVAVS